MEIKRIYVGMNYTNCYLVFNQKEGFLIDPGAEGEKIFKLITENQINLKKIILTHGHFDHIGAVDYLRKKTGALVYIHSLEKDFLLDANKNLSALVAGVEKVTTKKADKLLEDGGEIKIAKNISWQIIHTPGHSPGGICLYNSQEKILFSGDLIFANGTGRCDFPHSNHKKLLESIEKKILVLAEDTVVYPGHGLETKIKEFNNNYWKMIKFQ